MFSCATFMNWRSVAEQVCATAARPFPPRSRTREPMTTIAMASPAAAVKRGLTSSSGGRHSIPLLGRARLEDQTAIRPVTLHADPFVDPDCRSILRAYEQADRRHL